MEVEIVGARDYDLTDENGKRIQGVSLFILYPEDGVVGRMAEKRSMSGHYSTEFLIPGRYDIQFTPKGRISQILELPPQK